MEEIEKPEREEELSKPVPADGPKKIEVNYVPQGVSGIEIFGGIFSEDYLHSLTGSQRADKFDKMRRGDGRVKMCLKAVKDSIRSANWEWNVPEDAPDEIKEHAEFLNYAFTKGMDSKRWSVLLNEAMSCVEFGYSMFERTHKFVTGHKRWGDHYTFRNLGWRSPKTIEEWNFNRETGELDNVVQHQSSDFPQSVRRMPARWLSVITLEREGVDYEGMSMVRPSYGAWHRKQTYLKLAAIGMEKYSISTPVGKVPKGMENSKEYAAFKEALEIFTTHQSNYLTLPEGWDVEFKTGDFDPDKVKSLLSFENQEIVFSFLANFLELGANTTGSYSLSNDLSDFFLGGIQYVADMICEEFTAIGEELIRINHGPQEFYPELKASGISDKAGRELAEILKMFRESDMITPDDVLERHLRKRLDLPEMSDEGVRAKAAAAPAAFTEPSKRVIQLAEKKARAQIKEADEKLLKVIKGNIDRIGQDLAKRLAKEFAKNRDDNDAIGAVKTIKSRYSGDFYSDVKQTLTEVASDAIEQASKEVKPKGKSLAEFEELPKRVRKQIINQAELVATTITADLEKIMYFQFGDSIVSTQDEAIVRKDLIEASDSVKDKAGTRAAAANTASRMVNESRNAYFFQDDVLEEVVSFTFVNPDPVSPICKDLAGRTFEKDDPEAKRYFPPLHHNCKSYLVPNLKSPGRSPKISDIGLKPSKAELDKFVTLNE